MTNDAVTLVLSILLVALLLGAAAALLVGAADIARARARLRGPRSARLPRAPLGSVREDTDLARVAHELDVIRSRMR